MRSEKGYVGTLCHIVAKRGGRKPAAGVSVVLIAGFHFFQFFQASPAVCLWGGRPQEDIKTRVFGGVSCHVLCTVFVLTWPFCISKQCLLRVLQRSLHRGHSFSFVFDCLSP
uniref:Uncharacterized protein n=1 Tax=Rhizophora mucronata TaxID=61149 RepID=A0A2P2MJA0_RHIMU